MSTQKWFFSIQPKVKEYLKNNYASNSLCNQQVQKDFVYEYYLCTTGEGADEKTKSIAIVMNKRQQFAVYEMAALVNVK